MTHTVTAPLIIAINDEGSQVYVYQGQPIPGNIPAGEIKRLSEEGFIASDKPSK